jgi:proline iminopeptidase
MVTTPHTVHVADGLAIYSAGAGRPILLVPYPHGFLLEPMIAGPLAALLIGLGRTVITFDPPGFGASTRPPRVDMPEMLACIDEALSASGSSLPVDILGHSMGSLCALGYSLDHPEQVRKLALIGAVSGWPAVMRYGRHRTYGPFNPRFWQLAYYGLRVQWEAGHLGTFKALFNLMESDSYCDPRHFTPLVVEAGDRDKPIPVRMRWTRNQSVIDYAGRLGAITAPTLVCVGRHDIETPVAMNEELARGLPFGELVVFERSGHSPFIEEPEHFAAVIGEFLNRADPD